MAMALLSSAAFAADNATMPKVKVRSSDKGSYSRVVFDWGNAPASAVKYTTRQSSDRIMITFADGVDLLTDGAAPASLSRITDYKIISPTQVEIVFAKGQNIRHLSADNRLIIDVKGDAVAKTASAADAQSNPVNLAAKIETAAGDPLVKDVAKTTEKTVIDKLAHEKNVIVDHGQNPSAVTAAEPEKKSDTKPKIYQIAITSTTAIPLAIFERNGYLWMVQGKENVKLPPQITTSQGAEPLGTFEPVPSMDGVSTFRIKVPPGLNMSATGSGLAWKLELTDRLQSEPIPVAYKRLFNASGKTVIPSILWPASTIARTVTIRDPDAGDAITVGLVESAKDFTGRPQSFIDFDSLPSYVGLAVLPKADDLKIARADNGVLFTRDGGIHIASDQDFMTAGQKAEPDHPPEQSSSAPATMDKPASRIYDFKGWQIGDKKSLSNNQRLIMSAMGNQTDAKKAEGLISLAKLSLSFNYAPEAIGYLELAQSYVPEIESNPEFMALMGAAEALSWKQKEAYQIFSNASLNDIGEIPYWKAYTLAKLDDWQQAAKILPNDTSVVASYSDDVKIPFGLTLAEIALREGSLEKAKKFLDLLESLRPHMELAYASAYDYLTGELERQTKKPEDAKDIWKKLSVGQDDLYRAKSRFALTMMQLDSKEITQDKAVDNLEGLRYAWRGDDLEVSINYNLAKIYLMKNEPVKALTLMQLAHTLNPSSEQGKKIDQDMHDTFKSLFTPEKIKNIPPVDILILYNEFASLLPAGAEGEAITRQLAERMATADLLPRASALLKKQLDDGLKGLEGANVAIRLATLQNMDMKPDDALASLDRAENLLKGLPSQDVLAKQEEIGLLRAKSYSLKGKPDDAFAALALLPQDDTSLKLRADIAWRGKKWQDAADSLEQLVQNQNITLTRPLSDDQADLLLNWAVALYLADNRYVLANLRERYSDAMAATTKAKKFDVVTRPRQSSLLADRETINSIIDETNIFKDFLTSFKTSDPVSKPAVIQPPSNGNVTNPNPANVPEALRNAPGLKTDEVLGD
ncbi:MAG TPA: hypothetical protein DCM27_04775 [Rhodospirillaceae bacterium]|nr:hypothetical protein [Rhodospirillaceae bacterium]